MNEDRSDFNNSLLIKIVTFLRGIGIEVVPADPDHATGIEVNSGRLLVDENKLIYPGDLLHEAGHLAVAPRDLRAGLSGKVELPEVEMEPVEAQAMAWSYAVCCHLEIDPAIFFHAGGYKGPAASLLLNYKSGVCPGLSGLQQADMAASNAMVQTGARPFPQLLKWTRDLSRP